jgi:hypothetical protein
MVRVFSYAIWDLVYNVRRLLLLCFGLKSIGQTVRKDR